MCKKLFVFTLLIMSCINDFYAQKSNDTFSGFDIAKRLTIPKNGYFWLADKYLKHTISYPKTLLTVNSDGEAERSNSLLFYSAFDASHLPVFCKIEHLIEQKSKISFRFRVGSLEDANRLEGK